MARIGVRIREVERRSSGEQIGLAPGDEILSINGHPIHDELALKFYAAEELIDIEIRRASGAHECLQVELAGDADLGVKLEDFRTRTCNNDCIFCFVDQLPPGARSSLRVKDDDYRLSFLYGNYVTLTNLADRELDRMIEQALSPIYVSVHTTDPTLRARIMGRKKADDLDRKIRKLVAGGIRLHTQIVLMPGINDGNNLRKTVFDLYAYNPGVRSIAIVPLGLSRHGTAKDRLVPVTAAYSREVLQQVIPWQDRFRTETGRTFAHLADEFYILGGVPLPETNRYDAFVQIEDGVGMVRKFLDDFEVELKRRRKPRPHLRGMLVTGKLFYPFLSTCMERFNTKFRSRLEVRKIENRFLGKSVTVAGLLSGRDIITALGKEPPADFVIIPDEAVSRTEGILLDDLTLQDLSRRLRKPVYPSGRTMRDFFSVLLEQI